MTEPAELSLTIDELARRTGMTARNIRAHQSRGLVPPPVMRGRTGYYGREHVERIELIKELQGKGFNLEAIRHLIDDAGGSTSEVLRFTRALREPFEEEEPRTITLAELRERWGGEVDLRLLDRAVELGLMRRLPDGRLEEPSPRLARAGAELAALGVPTETALDAAEELSRLAEGVAQLYVRLFLDYVWKPFERAGAPPERWPEVRAALERLRPLAAESLLAMFGIVMSRATQEAFGRELDRLGRLDERKSA